MDTTGTVTARVVTDYGLRSCTYCAYLTRSKHHRVVDTYTADGTGWVCDGCAASHSPRLVAAVDGYERELDCLAEDKSVSVGRARTICHESVALLTDGLDPRRTRVVVGTEADVGLLERAAHHVATRRGVMPSPRASTDPRRGRAARDLVGPQWGVARDHAPDVAGDGTASMTKLFDQLHELRDRAP